MKNTIWITSLILTTLGCLQFSGDYYFDFDQLEHYTSEIDELKLLEDESNLTENQMLQNQILLGDTPQDSKDTTFIKQLETIGFERKNIPVNKHQAIKELFREKQHAESEFTLCLPIYRDLIIFRKNGEIVGIAKICFDCDRHQIVGTAAKTDEFGQSGDYSTLAKILTE